MYTHDFTYLLIISEFLSNVIIQSRSRVRSNSEGTRLLTKSMVRRKCQIPTFLISFFLAETRLIVIGFSEKTASLLEPAIYLALFQVLIMSSQLNFHLNSSDSDFDVHVIYTND